MHRNFYAMSFDEMIKHMGDHKAFGHAVPDDCMKRLRMDKQLEEGLPGVYLGKWPELIVSGNGVTPEQAAEIILKTDYYFGALHWGPEMCHTNTAWFDREILKVFGMPCCFRRLDEAERDPWPKRGKGEDFNRRDHPWWQAFHAHEKALENLLTEMDWIHLEYLHQDQIGTSYIGGPHGWCQWNGGIYTAGHNIGKWPEVEAVYWELRRIAEAFPYLTMDVQLSNKEGCEDDGAPVVQFHVEDGMATVVPTAPTFLRRGERSLESECRALMMDPHREVGIRGDKLKELLTMVYGKVPQYHNPWYEEWRAKQE
jgi:hypothetical protein